ncbi:MAG TPA: YHS domain-containing protein [Candidatus Wunengus sp. YC63]|uniref:YHS domain-containing protein n=1 Tax=unclassified Candidatus Wunengus TaxID=3367695 RepID=UPI002712C22D|nr:YHS domain-containing protein [Candidatus Brocadiales bacterium]
MSCILRTVLTFTFIIGLGSNYVSKVLWACGGVCSEEGGHSSHESSGHVVQTKAEMKGGKGEIVKDPVCGMEVSDIKKASSEKYKGTVYYFCSKNCEKTFKKNPAPYTCGCAARMKDCDCGHCKGKEETCLCLSEKEEGETHEHTHEHTGVESHEEHKH